MCLRVCVCACVRALSFISGDNTVRRMPLCLTNSAATHTRRTHTPAKVTLAPAGEFTHCSQGHTCVCVKTLHLDPDTSWKPPPCATAASLFPPAASFPSVHFLFSEPHTYFIIATAVFSLFPARCDQLGDISPTDISR